MYRFSLAAIVAATLSTPAFACDGLEIMDPYAIRSTPMAPTGAAFMTIHNRGAQDCHLALVRSDVAQRTEFHTHIAGDNGVMRMVHVAEGFDLPAGGMLQLARGGKHVMFMGVTAPFEQGDQLAVTLVFADGSEHEVMVPVDLTRLGGAQGGHGMSGHGMAGHDN